MKVEIYHEVPATRTLVSGGETYDGAAASSWSLQDNITSIDCDIVAAFLNGLADELDPSYVHGQSQRQGITITTTWRVDVYQGSGEIPSTSVTSKRAKVVAAMLRGTAASIVEVHVTTKKSAMRGMEE